MGLQRRAWYRNLREIQKSSQHEEVVALRKSFYDAVGDHFEKQNRNIFYRFFVNLFDKLTFSKMLKANDAINAMHQYIHALELEIAYSHSELDTHENNAEQHRRVRFRFDEMRQDKRNLQSKVKLHPFLGKSN